MIIQEDINEECSCLRCGEIARKFNGGDLVGNVMECWKCGFKWSVDRDGDLRYGFDDSWFEWSVECPSGCLLIVRETGWNYNDQEGKDGSRTGFKAMVR